MLALAQMAALAVSAPQIKALLSALTVTFAFADAVTGIDDLTITPQGLVPGAARLVGDATLVGGVILVSLTGGSDGERYDVAVRATHAGGSVTERVAVIAVVDPLWTMPDGGASYLSLIEFVERFGLDESIAATDGAASGLIDRRFLIGALSDAQAEVEANLAARYTLPLTLVPGIIKTAIADLAAVRMYRRGAPDFVVDQAKVQRRVLERIASGSLPLPLPAGAAATAAASDAPIVSFSGGRSYPDNLADY